MEVTFYFLNYKCTVFLFSNTEFVAGVRAQWRRWGNTVALHGREYCLAPAAAITQYVQYCRGSYCRSSLQADESVRVGRIDHRLSRQPRESSQATYQIWCGTASPSCNGWRLRVALSQ